jgi:hypothetical protein
MGPGSKRKTSKISTIGPIPTFARNSQRSGLDGSVLGVNVPARDGGGIRVGEGTTNLGPDGKQRFEGYVGYGGATFILTQGQAIAEYTVNNATRIQTTGGTNVLKGHYASVGGIVAAGGVTYTASMVISVPAGGVAVTAKLADGSGGSPATVNPGETKLVSMTRTPNAGSGLALQFVAPTIEDSLDFYAWHPQLESKIYATPYQDPALGARAKESLIAAVSGGVLDPTQGTVFVCMEVNSVAKRQDTANQPYIFHAKGAGYGNLTLAHAKAVASFSFSTYADDMTYTSSTASDANIPNGRRVFGVRWDASEASVWLDGTKKITIPTPKLPGTMASLGLLCATNATGQAGAPIYWAQCSPLALTDAEMAAITTNTQGVPVAVRGCTLLANYGNGGKASGLGLGPTL